MKPEIFISLLVLAVAGFVLFNYFISPYAKNKVYQEIDKLNLQSTDFARSLRSSWLLKVQRRPLLNPVPFRQSSSDGHGQGQSPRLQVEQASGSSVHFTLTHCEKLVKDDQNLVMPKLPLNQKQI